MDKKAMRRRLEADLETLLGRHSKLTGHLRNKDREIPLDWSEMAQFMENDEVLEALEERTREHCEDIARALRRMEEGTYGTCGSCDQAISAERLDIVPTTALCANCA